MALTPNEKGAATGAGGLDFGNLLYDALVKLDGPTAQAAFTQLSGEYHASQQTARVNDSRYVREAMEQRLRQAMRTPMRRSSATRDWTPGHTHGVTGARPTATATPANSRTTATDS